jgi:hypothetical protein
MPHAAACPSTKEPCTVYELHSDITSKSTTASGATNGWAILCSPLGPARGEPISETLLHATLHTTASQEQDIRTSSVCKLLLKLLAGLRKRAPGEDRSAPPSTVGRMPTLANTRPRVHFTQTDGRAGSVVPLDPWMDIESLPLERHLHDQDPSRAAYEAWMDSTAMCHDSDNTLYVPVATYIICKHGLQKCRHCLPLTKPRETHG